MLDSDCDHMQAPLLKSFSCWCHCSSLLMLTISWWKWKFLMRIFVLNAS